MLEQQALIRVACFLAVPAATAAREVAVPGGFDGD